MEVYNTIKLPNGGIIQMDKLAYDTYQGSFSSNYSGEWTLTLDFSDNNIEKAIAPQQDVEIR